MFRSRAHDEARRADHRAKFFEADPEAASFRNNERLTIRPNLGHFMKCGRSKIWIQDPTTSGAATMTLVALHESPTQTTARTRTLIEPLPISFATKPNAHRHRSGVRTAASSGPIRPLSGNANLGQSKICASPQVMRAPSTCASTSQRTRPTTPARSHTTCACSGDVASVAMRASADFASPAETAANSASAAYAAIFTLLWYQEHEISSCAPHSKS